MIHLPIVKHLSISNFRLFPGSPPGIGLDWTFPSGLSLIAGINGLGKTTLITMILRTLTGPYDITSDGMPPSLNVVLPEKPASLKRRGIRFFASRVADGAENAEARLTTTICGTEITITRCLSDLSLKTLTRDGVHITLPNTTRRREESIQAVVAQLMGLGSFVDVLLVLHHLVFFLENRPGALWDENAQRQILRALCLDEASASHIAALERQLQSADSQARNVHARMESTRADLVEVRLRYAETEGVLAELEIEETLLRAETDEARRLEETLATLDVDRKKARLAYERAKTEREYAADEAERLKYTILLRYFPSMRDATRLVLSRMLVDGHCLVCNSDASHKREELEASIAQGFCPVCGSEPKKDDWVVPSHEFEQTNLESAFVRLAAAVEGERARAREVDELTTQYRDTLDEFTKVHDSIQERQYRGQRLRTELPSEDSITEYESTLRALESQYRHWDLVRASVRRELESLLSENNEDLMSKSDRLMEVFSFLTESLLAEDVRLVQVSTEPRYLQSPGDRADRIEVPAYAAEMIGADHTGFVQRNDPSEVSESQRELIDLAFRLALIEVFSGTGTFVMETPEASLDVLAMERVGKTLANFSAANSNRLVVTSNLTNVGVVSALFARTPPTQDLDERFARVLDLMNVAAPNRALLHNRERYQELLRAALSVDVQ